MAHAEATGARANLRRGKVKRQARGVVSGSWDLILVSSTLGEESWQLPTFH